MSEILITRRGGLGGGATTNVLAIWNGDANSTITATLGSKVITAITDASGYAYMTNLDVGTWTLQATKTGRYVGPRTLEVSATQTAYYIKYPFRTYAYDGSLNDGGSAGANVCADFSGGWEGNGGGGTTNYNLTNINRTTTGQYQQRLSTVNAIDLTPFNTLYVDCKTHYADGRVGITTTKFGSTYRTYSKTDTTNRVTMSIDVSNFNNVTGYILAGQVYGSVTVYSAWFE